MVTAEHANDIFWKTKDAWQACDTNIEAQRARQRAEILIQKGKPIFQSTSGHVTPAFLFQEYCGIEYSQDALVEKRRQRTKYLGEASEREEAARKKSHNNLTMTMYIGAGMAAAAGCAELVQPWMGAAAHIVAEFCENVGTLGNYLVMAGAGLGFTGALLPTLVAQNRHQKEAEKRRNQQEFLAQAQAEEKHMPELMRAMTALHTGDADTLKDLLNEAAFLLDVTREDENKRADACRGFCRESEDTGQSWRAQRLMAHN